MFSFLFTAVLFYIIGRISGQEHKILSSIHQKYHVVFPSTPPPLDIQTASIDEIIEDTKSRPQKKLIHPGVIPFKTEQQIQDIKSGDKALEDHWRQTGLNEDFFK